MKDGKVLVGVIGSGFARTSHLPGFRACAGAEVLAICSGTRSNAEAAAQQYCIPHVVSDYEEMMLIEELDLIDVVTPPYLHHPMVMAALEAGKHVLCEKPMAMNSREAEAMYEKAEDAGVVHLIDHELRFNPTRKRMKDLIDDGYIGRLRNVALATISNSGRDAYSRRWSWWYQQEKGGGMMGANGSHQIDQLRWWFGDIDSVCGRVLTFVKDRAMPASCEMRPVTTDDFNSFLMRFTNGAEGMVFLTSVACHTRGSRIEAFGDEGSLILEGDKLRGAQKGQDEFEDLSVPDPAESLDGILPNIWSRSFVHLAQHMIDAIRLGKKVDEGATFYDGMRCQQVMDAVRASCEQGRWAATDAASLT